MKLCNKKIVTMTLLVLCVVSLGFVGAVSAEEYVLTLSPDQVTIDTGNTVEFTFPYNGNYNYTAVSKKSGSDSSNDISISSPESGKFTTPAFENAGTYTIILTAKNKTDETEEPKKEAQVTVKEKVIVYTPTISNFATADSTTGTVPLTVNFTFTSTNATSYQLRDGDTDVGKAISAIDVENNRISYTFTSAGTYKIKLRAYNDTLYADSNPITITVEDKVTTKTINEINISLKEPAIDDTPATNTQFTCTGGVQCDSIEWSSDNFETRLGSNAKFKTDTIYSAKVTLSNLSGYEFGSAKPTIKVNGKSFVSDNVNAEFEGKKLVVSLKCFDKTSAEITSVSATVTAPFSGETPDTEAVSGNENLYSVYLTEWYEEGSSTPMKSTDKFESNTVYSVNITLKAKGNKQIFNSSLNVSDATINGNHASYVKHNSDTVIVISYIFPKTVALPGPEITFSISPTSPKIPSNANTVTVTYSYTISGNPTTATLYFGEGTEIDLGSATNGVITGTRTHDFNSLGTFTAYVTARNANGPTTKTIEFSVGQDVLAAILEAGPLSGTAPLSVTCNDKSSGTIMTRTWNFGDGSVASHETSTSHTYTSPGTYTITLTVSDGRDTSTATKVITVTEAKKQETTTPEKEPKEPVDYEPFFTIGDVDVPSPVDLIAEFVRLFQSMFDFDNYHIFSNETTEDE